MTSSLPDSLLDPMSSSASPAASAASPTAPRVVPVITFIRRIGDCIRASLEASASPAGELYRSGALQVVDMPIPRLVGNKQNPMTGPYEECPGRPVWDLTPEQQEIVEQAEVIVLDAHSGGPVLLAPHDNLPADKQQIFQRLKWVQGTYAGVDTYLSQLHDNMESGRGVVKPEFTVSRAGGIMPRIIGQYIFGYVTLLERKILEAKQFQSQDEYARLQMAAFRWAPSVTIGILGLGDIGRGIGRMLRAAGYRVIGFKRRVTAGTATGAGEDDESTELAADRVTDQLDEVLENSDYLVNVLPSTAATRYLLTKEKLDKCRARRPVFMNVGRGDVIAESVLLDELDEKTGAFSFAVLDVFEKEPLPKESALYQHPRVLLTPHVSGKVFPEDVGDLFVKNLDRYLEGKRVRFAVDWSLGY